jgi:hypothetical protein
MAYSVRYVRVLHACQPVHASISSGARVEVGVEAGYVRGPYPAILPSPYALSSSPCATIRWERPHPQVVLLTGLRQLTGSLANVNVKPFTRGEQKGKSLRSAPSLNLPIPISPRNYCAPSSVK